MEQEKTQNSELDVLKARRFSLQTKIDNELRANAPGTEQEAGPINAKIESLRRELEEINTRIQELQK